MTSFRLNKCLGPRGRRLGPAVRREHGQTMAEVAVIVTFCVILFVGFWEMWEGPLRAYYDRLAAVIALPSP